MFSLSLTLEDVLTEVGGHILTDVGGDVLTEVFWIFENCEGLNEALCSG